MLKILQVKNRQVKNSKLGPSFKKPAVYEKDLLYGRWYVMSGGVPVGPYNSKKIALDMAQMESVAVWAEKRKGRGFERAVELIRDNLIEMSEMF